MSTNKDAVLGEAVLPDGETVEITASSPMPGPEPGHAVAANPASAEGIFDPNAARRMAEGRGPGLQDSERQQPAHWQTAEGVAEADIVAAQRAAATALAGIPEGTPDLRPEAKGKGAVALPKATSSSGSGK